LEACATQFLTNVLLRANNQFVTKGQAESCQSQDLGYGSFWGTPDVYMDDLVLHDRVLTWLEVRALRQMMSRVYDIGKAAGIDEVLMDVPVARPADDVIYDLSGRRVEHPVKGIYIRNGKKFIVR